MCWRTQPHLRTPGYIFGCHGVVESVAGVFPDPQLLAFRDEGPHQPLYRVKFKQVGADSSRCPALSLLLVLSAGWA